MRLVEMKLLPILALSVGLLLQFRGSLGVTITSAFNNSRPRLGETITLSCDIAGGGFGGYVEWKKDNDLIANSSSCSRSWWVTSRLRKIKCDKNNFNFLLSNIQISDRGIYECRTIPLTTVTTSITLDVLGPPSTPSNLEIVNSTAVAVTLSWISEFDGGSEQRFYVQYKKSAENWLASEVPKGGIIDPGRKKVVYHRAIDLESNVLYQFRVFSKNSIAGTHRSNFSNVASGKSSEKPQTSLIGMSRTKDTITLRWRQVTGKYAVIKINYCKMDTGDCMNYTVPNPGDKHATFIVDVNKTYYYHMVIEDGGDVVYRSPDITDEVNDKTNIAVIEGLVGVVVVAIASIVVAVVLWKRGLLRCRKMNIPRPANNTVDYDDTRVELTSPRNSSAQPSYVNIGELYVNDAFHPASTADENPAQCEISGHQFPARGVPGNKLASSDDDEGLYNSVPDEYTTRQQGISAYSFCSPSESD